MTFLEIYPLIEVFNLYTQSLSNMSSGVMYNCTLARLEKISPNSDMLVEIYGLQTRKVTRGYICIGHTMK